MKKTLALLLSAAILLPLFASCGDKPDATDSSVETTVQTEPAVTEDTPDVPDAAELQIGGDFNILVAGNWAWNDYESDGTDGTVVDSAIFRRNKYMLDTYGVDVKNEDIVEYSTAMGSGKGYMRLYTGYMSGTNEFDAAMIGTYDVATLAYSSVLEDLHEVPYIDLSKDYWDQKANEDLTIGGRMFYTTGEISLSDNRSTNVLFFNKEMIKSYGLDNPYELVRNDEWTFDKFAELCKGVTRDSNADGVLDEFDTWGFGTETYNVFIHTVAAGESIVKKDADDIPYFTFRSESTYSALNKIMDFYLDKSTVMIANDGRFDSKGYSNVWEATIIKAFQEGRELFFCCGLMNVPGFRSMDDQFGILPVPKTNPEQDSYYHSVSMHNMSALCVPNIATDYTELGYIIESLAAESKNTVTPAYYEKNLKYQQLSDDESGEMLDIIFATRSFDLGTVFNWGGILGQFMTVDTNFVSRFESVYSQAEKALEDTLTALENMS